MSNNLPKHLSRSVAFIENNKRSFCVGVMVNNKIC